MAAKNNDDKPGAFGRALTQLASLKRNKNKLENPFTILGGISHPTSWYDVCVPNIMWASLITQVLPRDDYLQLFRNVVFAARDKVEKCKELYVTHNFLAIATPEEFDTMMAPVLAEPRLKDVMGALLVLDWFPDKEHWARHYEPNDKAAAYLRMIEAVGHVHPHQSEPATDLRWFKWLFYVEVLEKIKFAEEMMERLDQMLHFPNKGDLKSVRPAIRAQELMTRMYEFQEGDAPKYWPADRPRMAEYKSEDFWNEVFRNSHCLVVSDARSGERAADKVTDDIYAMTREISKHFMQTITTTYADPRHEGSFGLVLYALNIALSSSLSQSNSLAEGRTILRTIVELYITLHYLAKEDNPTIWQQYRSYGIGQTKLALLKNLKAEDVPKYLSAEELEELANEDRWLEFEDIDLGNWANMNLRKMAEGCGVKDVYDKFYDWTSGFVHGQWGCIRQTTFTTCLNPLHRFHRVPGEVLQWMPSVMADACGLINRMIDDLNSLYPVFKPRLTAHKAVAEEAQKDGKLIETDFEVEA